METEGRTWGVQAARDYKTGYLTGALMTDGQFGGFYPDTLILLRNKKEDLAGLSEKVAGYATDIAPHQQLIPAPKVLSYADGSYGIESVALRDAVTHLIAKITKEPLPALSECSSRFYEGFLSGAIEVTGHMDKGRIWISESPNLRPSIGAFFVELLKQLDCESVCTGCAVVIAGRKECEKFLMRLNNPELSMKFANL